MAGSVGLGQAGADHAGEGGRHEPVRTGPAAEAGDHTAVSRAAVARYAAS